MNTIETRLAKLERANRRYKTILIIISSVISIVMITSFKNNFVPDLIQAKKFEVVDSKGNVLVRIGDFEGDGRVTTFNNFNNILTDIVASTDGHGAAVFYNGGGKRNFVITNVSGGGGQLNINDNNEHQVVSIGRNNKNAGSFIIKNISGNSIVNITGDTNDDGAILTYKNGGAQSGRLPQ